MKKILLSVLSLLAGYGAYAEQVPADRAMKVASCFSESIQGSAFRSAPALRLVYEAKDELRATGGETRFYVFNRGEADGFVIVSGDDRALPVLGYATSGSFSYDEAPANMKAWLDGYADENKNDKASEQNDYRQHRAQPPSLLFWALGVP